MKSLMFIATGFLLSLYGAEAIPTGTTYRAVMVNTNDGRLVNSDTNFAAANGIATTGQVGAVQQTAASAQAQADLALGTGATAVASIAGHLVSTNPHAITPMMIGAATSNQGVLAETALQTAGGTVTGMITICNGSSAGLLRLISGAPAVTNYLYNDGGRLRFHEWGDAGGFVWTDLTLTNVTQIGASWHTNTVVSAVQTNESGAVTGLVTEALIYLGTP